MFGEVNKFRTMFVSFEVSRGRGGEKNLEDPKRNFYTLLLDIPQKFFI